MVKKLILRMLTKEGGKFKCEFKCIHMSAPSQRFWIQFASSSM